jgi:hypothetical protein
MLSNSLSLSFAQKWQQVAEEQAQRSQELLRQEGIAFFDATLAHRWRMLRKDLGYFQATGDARNAADIMQEMDMLMQDDEAAEQQNRDLFFIEDERARWGYDQEEGPDLDAAWANQGLGYAALSTGDVR